MLTKYPRNVSSINNVRTSSSRDDKFINAAIACCAVFAVCVNESPETYISIPHKDFEHSTTFPVISLPDIEVWVSGLGVREEVFHSELPDDGVFIAKETDELEEC
jgi:hypothetical protein